jgi:hypothetical protein
MFQKPGCWLLTIGCWLLVSVAFSQNEIEKIDNKDKSFTLVKNDTINGSGIPVLKYKVMRNADKRMIMEGTITMGLMEWSADYELTESKSLGSGSSTNLQTRRIDLRPYLLRK